MRVNIQGFLNLCRFSASTQQMLYLPTPGKP
jgi:hypothetical protein